MGAGELSGAEGNLLRRRHLQLSEEAHYRTLRKAEAAELHVVVHVAGDYGLRHAEGDEGSGRRLLIVGYESGDPQILKNIKKGATIDMAQRFTDNCHKLGLTIHADFIVGLPGETRTAFGGRSISPSGSIPRRFRSRLRIRIRVPSSTNTRRQNNLITIDSMTDEKGHQLPNIIYPGLNRGELVEWVERFYGEYYFRPKAVWRVVKKAVVNNDVPRLYKEATGVYVPSSQAQAVREGAQKTTAAAVGLSGMGD